VAGAGGKQVGQVSIRVVPDLDEFREELKAELEKWEKKTADIQARLKDSGKQLTDDIEKSTKNLTADVAAKATGTEKLAKDIQGAAKGSKAKVQIDVEPNPDRASFNTKLRGFLAGVGRGLRGNAGVIKVPVEVDLERRGLGRSIRSFVSAIRGAFSNAAATARSGLDTLVSSFGGLSKAFKRFSPESIIQAVAIIGAVAALAAPAISLLSGALLTLPAALAGILVPIGVVALGLDGIKKAAETAKPAFEELKKAVSDTFENGLKPGFELIRDRLLPGLTEPLKGVASSLSTAFNSVIGTLSSPTGLNNLQRTVDNIGVAIRAAAPGLQSFTSGLTSLVANVTAKFPNLSESFNNVGKDFDNWIAKITSNGQLDTALDTLGGTLSEIGGTIKDIAQWGFDNLADPVFGAQLKGFAQDLRALVNETLPLLKSGFQDVATVVSGIRDTIDTIKGVSDTFAKLTGVQKEMSKGPKQTEGFLGLFGKDGVLGDNAPFRKSDWAGGFFKDLFPPNEAKLYGNQAGEEAGAGLNKGLASSLEQTKKNIENSLKPQPGVVSGVFGGGVDKDGIGPAITGKVNTAISAAKSTLTAFQGEFAGMIATALQPVEQIPTKLNTTFASLGAAFVGAFSALKGIVTTEVTAISNSIALGFQQIPAKLNVAWAGLGASVAGALGALKGVVTSNMAGITDAFGQAFAGVAGRVASALSGVPAAVGAAITPAIGVVQAVMTGIINLVSIAGSQIAGVASATFAQFPPAVQGAMAPAIAAVGDICQQMVSTALSFAGAMESAGRSIGASFAVGITSTTGIVKAAATALMDAARPVFPNSPAKEGPFSGSGWVDRSGESVGQAFAAGMESSVGGVVEIARVMMQQVKDVFGNAEGLVINFNFNEVAQPISQFSNSIAGIGTSMAGALPAAQEFQQTLGQTGQSLAMLDSSQSKGRIEELKKSLLELEIQRKQLEAARDTPGADQAAIKAQIEQIRNQKNLLGLERDKLTYAQKYGGQMDSTTQSYKEQINGLQQIPFDFATATGNQFMSDLGWSGQGAIPSLMQQGLDYATSFVFNVANMDDALSGQKVLQNRQMQATIGR
jgi:phage-related protein